MAGGWRSLRRERRLLEKVVNAIWVSGGGAAADRSAPRCWCGTKSRGRERRSRKTVARIAARPAYESDEIGLFIDSIGARYERFDVSVSSSIGGFAARSKSTWLVPGAKGTASSPWSRSIWRPGAANQQS